MCDRCLNDEAKARIKREVDMAAEMDAKLIKGAFSKAGLDKINVALDRLAELANYDALSERDRVFMLACIVIFGRELKLPLDAMIGSMGHAMAIAQLLLPNKGDDDTLNIPDNLSDMFGDERH